MLKYQSEQVSEAFVIVKTSSFNKIVQTLRAYFSESWVNIMANSAGLGVFKNMFKWNKWIIITIK